MTALEFNCSFGYVSGFSLNFAFSVEDGVTALVGPSGSGKTTVLHLIAGLLKPKSGSIIVHERTLFDSQSGINVSPERRGIGIVFQDYQLFPHLTVDENLRYGQRRRKDSRFDKSKVTETLDLGDVLDRYPVTLSGGQRQRVAMGRAILSGPELLLLDEPLSALDHALRDAIILYLTHVIEEFRLPTILVSHDRDSVRRLAQSTIEMPAK